MLFPNLYNVPTHLGFAVAIFASLILGIIHGITPDEHTWPITFSYAIGMRSRKKGATAGLVFSLGFVLQRSLMSEVAYFALAGIFMTSLVFGLTYVAVGFGMFLAGLYLMSSMKYFHWHWLEEKLGSLIRLHGSSRLKKIENRELAHTVNPVECIECQKPIPTKLAFVHGLIAGFGFGAFALILYTIISPGMPNAYVGWVPGFMFGIGTMIMQVAIGLGAGSLLKKIKGVGEKGMQFIAHNMTKDILYYGGIVFVAAGIAVLLFPPILNFGIQTGIKIHNLGNLGIGFFLVLFTVGAIGILSFIKSMNALKKAGKKTKLMKSAAGKI
ncbi:MAG: hypothetical protein M1331_00860 [Candidatus Marsarchaeota archaeon]|nr:hypothetical protein [Candidatus Marsarchaeota archaeon]